MSRSAAWLMVVALLGVFALPGTDTPKTPPAFTDVTAEAGITWRHFNGESPDRFLIEASSGGVGFLDYDRDGRMDLYLVNGGETPRGRSPHPLRNALYRNLGEGRFQEVAARAGVDRTPFYGMGIAASDYDNDGFTDLYVTGFPSSALFRNQGDGTYREVTQESGVANSGEWAASAAWFDYDRDGLLDLFVCNYATLDFAKPLRCDYQGIPDYCQQRAYQGRQSRLYRNRGNGTFVDASEASGISRQVGRAFGVVSLDADGDGWTDLFVANDADPNLFLINQKDGTFKDAGLDAEVAYNQDGMARSGMGVDAGDVNGDGLPDFVVTNFHDEYHSLHLGSTHFPFEERTRQSRLARFTRPYVGWGVRLLDYDNDSDLDLLIANGHVTKTIELLRPDIAYRQLPLLLTNSGEGRFEDAKQKSGLVFQQPHSARGLAVADYDNDGDPDAALARLNDVPVLLRNNVGQANRWVGFHLQGRASNRDAIGSRVTVDWGEKGQLVRWLTGGASFLASHDRRILFGLGSSERQTVDVEIDWPSGRRQILADLPTNRYHQIVEAGGQLEGN